jgi:SAM-dependent methyltransferase
VFPRHRPRYCRRAWTGSTASNSAAEPATSRPGSHAAAPARSAWTTPRRSWPPRGGLQERFGLRFPLVHASAERAPFADATFDLAISEYGASIWCDPYAWIPEAARLLRPGGQLIFLVNSVLLMLTIPDQDGLPATERLLRPYFGMHRFTWPDDDSVEFHLGHGDMIRLLRRYDLQIEDLQEIQPSPGAATQHPLATIEWARQWPCEEIWKARKRH